MQRKRAEERSGAVIERSAEYYEMKAKEAVAHAQQMRSEKARDAMLSIAASYYQLAADSRRREAAKAKRSE
jgi:hypothetical protein